MSHDLIASFKARPVLTFVSGGIAVRLATLTLLFLASRVVPSFDTSALVLLPATHHYLEPLVRWDTLYFANIAVRGYLNEQEMAFMPGLPVVMHLAGRGVRWAGGGGPVEVQEAVIGGVLATAMAGIAATVALYKLSLELSQQQSFAILTTCLYLIPPSPPTLSAVPYTEPFAALFTFLGMLFFTRRQFLSASLCWAVGSIFRAQGVILGAGFFGWHYVLVAPFAGGRFSTKRLASGLPAFAMLAIVSAAPFFLFQAWAYSSFCGGEASRRPWCDEGLGLSYGWIQREYWNVGPFRYWTLLQLPNFLLAAPVLALSFAASYTFYAHNLHAVLSTTVPFIPLLKSWKPTTTTKDLLRASPRPFLSPSLTPFVHLHTALTLLLLFASHVQIILRVCSTNPVVFWFAADLVSHHTADGKERKWGRRWIKYCVVWGVVATILWSAFYPPA